MSNVLFVFVMIDFCVSKPISFATKLYMFSIFADKIDFTQSAKILQQGNNNDNGTLNFLYFQKFRYSITFTT